LGLPHISPFDRFKIINTSNFKHENKFNQILFPGGPGVKGSGVLEPELDQFVVQEGYYRGYRGCFWHVWSTFAKSKVYLSSILHNLS